MEECGYNTNVITYLIQGLKEKDLDDFLINLSEGVEERLAFYKERVEYLERLKEILIRIGYLEEKKEKIEEKKPDWRRWWDWKQ